MSIENFTVFVVEDDGETRESFVALFTSHGLKVESFPSSEEFLRNFKPDGTGCIVTDLRLENIGGIDLHRVLVEAGYAIPVILISGYLNVRTAIHAVEQGIFRVLEKPYQDDELIGAVWAAIRQDKKLRRQRVYRVDFSHRLATLDPRERLTLEMIIAGHGNHAIERRLGLSTRSVDRIRHSILEKMNFLSFVELSAAYGAAQWAGHPTSTNRAIGTGDVSAKSDPDERYDECLHEGLLRIQAILLGDGEIGEDSRPLLRDAELALSKAFGKLHRDHDFTSTSVDTIVDS